ncbi:MAG: fluoride efflux transporter CrcB [Parahaliea sp.]
MKFIVFIAMGGAAGALSRYLISNWLHSLWEVRWPLATLLVNIVGSLLIGVVFVLLERQLIHPHWRGALMVGFLGAFTTFSTFSLEMIGLLERGSYLPAFGYMLSSAVICVLAAGAGIALTRLLTAGL